MGLFTKKSPPTVNETFTFVMTYDELTSLFNYVLEQTIATLVHEECINPEIADEWLAGHICVPVKASSTHSHFIENNKHIIQDKKEVFVPMIVNACGMEAINELNISDPNESETEPVEKEKNEKGPKDNLVHFKKNEDDDKK